MMLHQMVARQLYSLAGLLNLLYFSTQVLANRFPIGSKLDRALPYQGSINSHLPPWVRRRGFWDPMSQIVCVGPMPTWSVPNKLLAEDYRGLGFENGWKPNLHKVYSNMTALCAKTAYEGSYTAWTAGGYCAASAGPRTVVFEKLPPGSGPMDELIKDIYLVCQHSCQCLEGDYETIVNQGRPARAVVEAQENTNRQMEIGDPVYAPLTKPLAPRARLHNTYPPVGAGSHVHVPAYFIPEVDARHLGPGERISETNAATTLWLSPPDGSWAPECSGDFERATFGLPSVTAQEACAADWFGGNIRGNAGLVCKPPTTIMPIDHLFTDESVCHPVYRGLAVNQQGNDDIYKYTIRECRLSCRCVKPEKPAAPPQTVLVEGIFDAARDFIHGVCRVNQIKSAVSNAFACTGLTGSSRGGSKYRNMNVAVRRNQLCSTQKVNGFALAASLAAQQLCYESTRGIRGNSQMG